MNEVDVILAGPHAQTLEKILADGVPKFAYYTSAETALSILRNSEIWMRNASLMNDYSEIAYGIDRIVENFSRETQFGKTLSEASDRLSIDLFSDFAKSFDSWIYDLKTNTFLTCISLHDAKHESQYGRLSMWRAYAPKNGVALIINSEPMLRVEDRMGVFSTPVFYWSVDEARDQFSKMAKELKHFLLKMTPDQWPEVKSSLTHFLRIYALSIKHPGFAEEKEWRVYFRPAEDKSKYVTPSIECIDGFPQTVQKLKLSSEVETSVEELFDSLIIGPAEHQFQLADTFVRALEELEFDDAAKRVVASSIPLRS